MNSRYVKNGFAFYFFALLFSIALFAKLPPAIKLLPSGFKLITEKDISGTSTFITAKKANQNAPKFLYEPSITLEISWVLQPMVDQVIQMLAAQPEAPAGNGPSPFIKEEPCGKRKAHDGVLTCRKIITSPESTKEGAPATTWCITWTGKGSGGMVTVKISNYYGTQKNAISLVESLVPKVSKGK